MAEMGLAPKTEKDIFRPLANFPPSVWGYSFASFSSLNPEFELYTREVEVLKGQVKDSLWKSKGELSENIKYINLLCRLGVSYHFESEIEEQLGQILIDLPKLLNNNDYDLHIVALLFRVLREYGYKMSCDVFKKFKNNNGEFKESITNDVKGLLSLYEATFLSVHGEDILDEALAFTRQHLETLAAKTSPHLAKRIKNALLRPVHQGIERIEARQFISFYEEEESRNEILLKFAKLDFNRLQILYKQELALVSRWWKDLNFAEKLPYSRDRIVEVYLWAIGAHFEPQYALARVMITKYTKMISVVDDTYDAYGTIDELQRFTSAFQRCSIDAIDELPEYMKVLYRGALNLFDETMKDGTGERSYRTSYAQETFKELVKSYYTEAKWFNDGHVPPVKEYISNGLVSTAYSVQPAASFIGMENVVGINEYQWVQKNPKIVNAAKLICRLMDDITTHEDEQRRGHCASSIECYMKEYGVSQKEAIEEIQKICAHAWKDINEECMKPTAVSRTLLKYYVNLVRVIDFVYKFMDSYTYASSLKDEITSLFLEQLPM